jgi:hypothetical protein
LPQSFSAPGIMFPARRNIYSSSTVDCRCLAAYFDPRKQHFKAKT